MKKLNKFLLIFFLTSCSLITSSKKTNLLEGYTLFNDKDFVDFYSSLGETYRNFNSSKIWVIEGSSYKYLTNIYERLRKNNELLLKRTERPKFFVIVNKRPLYFALPNGHYYFSTGLFKKYLRNEDLLFALMARETIRWQYNLYPKKFKVPMGYISGEELINLIRLPLELKVEINKWSYNAIKRSGIDASVYLNWLQLQNKNVLDFSMLLGDVNIMAKEEFLFKDFLIGLDIADSKSEYERSSNEEFYKLQGKIRKAYETRKIRKVIN